MQLDGRIAIITGAGLGLGRSVARRFALEGARVILAERNVEHGARVAEELCSRGCEAMFIHTDVTDEHSVKSMVAQVLARFGGVDILFNNAAILLRNDDTRVHQLSMQAWTETLAVNLTGLWLCSKYVLGCMMDGGKAGVIINMASPTGLRSCAPGLSAYSASKGGVIALTRVMAADYAADHIRVNAIVPGTMATPMNADVIEDPAAHADLLARIPMGRMGSPDEIDGMAVFLASDASLYCTGGIYMVDGGMSAI